SGHRAPAAGRAPVPLDLARRPAVAVEARDALPVGVGDGERPALDALDVGPESRDRAGAELVEPRPAERRFRLARLHRHPRRDEIGGLALKHLARAAWREAVGLRRIDLQFEHRTFDLDLDTVFALDREAVEYGALGVAAQHLVRRSRIASCRRRAH